ncbi:hypothetical protein KAS08_05400 [Candidatus Pacearchaeota archaeon]|nr:hypothetical protein [Candidatus Pacearchaeota archaeon]
MDREISDRNILNKFTEDFCKIVNNFAKYIIVSGFVAISHGRSRGTEDIDIMIERLSFVKFGEMHNALVLAGFECLYPLKTKNIYENLTGKLNVRYSWKGIELPNMEVKFAKDSLDDEQLETRKKIEFTDVDVFFPKIEESIAFKEEFLGSNKDIEDAKHLRLIYLDRLDEDYIEKYKEKIRRIKFNETR